MMFFFCWEEETPEVRSLWTLGLIQIHFGGVLASFGKNTENSIKLSLFFLAVFGCLKDFPI